MNLIILLLSSLYLDSSVCLECHEPADPQAISDEEIDLATFNRSIHADLDCQDCHIDAEEDHEPGLERVDCSSCHEEEQEALNRSIHIRRKVDITCTSCHGDHGILPASDPDSTVFASRVPQTCGTCHDETEEPWLYQSSVHFKALTKGGLIVSANCTTCHGSHAILGRTDDDSPTNRFKIAETCSKCHQGAYEDWRVSVHGVAFMNGDLEAPVCTHCHDEHNIRDRQDPLSSVNTMTVSSATCTPCHARKRTGTEIISYRDSFHGLASKFGNPEVASCASCHGSHKILPAADQSSTINPQNLPQTCGKCHSGAGENFSIGAIHRPAESEGGFWLILVRYVYFFLIGFTMLFMFGHNFLDYLKKLRETHKRNRKKWSHRRFEVFERVQHLILVISFFVLVVTGFALKFPDSFWVQPLLDLNLSFLVRSNGHRIAAIIFMALSVLHLAYLAFSSRGRGQVRAMIPSLQDAREFLHQMRYYLDLEKHPSRFGRYSYAEKMEYLALVWGSIVMVITGLILWFEEFALQVMPKWGWDLSELIHYYEAWLATLSIIVWHLYHVLFKPGAQEFTLAMITGDLNRESMHHEHARELEELEGTEEPPTEALPEPLGIDQDTGGDS